MSKYNELLKYVGNKKLDRYYDVKRLDNNDIFCGWDYTDHENGETTHNGIFIHPDNTFTITNPDHFKGALSAFFYRCSPYSLILEEKIDGTYIGNTLWTGEPLTFNADGKCISEIKESGHTHDKRVKFNRFMREFNKQALAITKITLTEIVELMNNTQWYSHAPEFIKNLREQTHKVYTADITPATLSIIYGNELYRRFHWKTSGSDLSTHTLTRLLKEFRNNYSKSLYIEMLNEEATYPEWFEKLEEKRTKPRKKQP